MSYFCYAHNWASHNASCPTCHKEEHSHIAFVDTPKTIQGEKIFELQRELQTLRTRNAELEAENSRLLHLSQSQAQELEVAKSPGYCPACGHCGENGCCDARKCQYPDVKKEEIDEVKSALELSGKVNLSLTDRLTALESESEKLRRLRKEAGDVILFYAADRNWNGGQIKSKDHDKGMRNFGLVGGKRARALMASEIWKETELA